MERPTCLSQNSYLSPSLPGGVWFSGCLSSLVSKFIFVSQSAWWCLVLRMSVFTCLKIHICLPVWLVVSGSPDVCLHLSQNLYLSPSLAGCVRFSGCLSSLVSKFIFVSQSGWWCLVLRMSVFTCLKIHICLPVCLVVLRMSVFTCLKIHICLPVWLVVLRMSVFTFSKFIFVSQSGWWCPVLRMSVFTCLKIHICLPVWLVVSGSPDVCLHLSQNSYLSPSLPGGVWFSGCLSSLVSKFIFVSQSAWWCLVLRMSVFTCLKIHICLPVWLVLSGSPDVCLHLSQNSYLSPTLAGCVRLFGCVSSLISFHLSPTLSNGCLLRAFTCLSYSSCVSGHHLSLFMCLWACVSLINLSPVIGLPLWCCPALSPVCLCVSSIICLHHLSRTSFVSEVICLQSYACLSGGVLFQFHNDFIFVSCMYLSFLPLCLLVVPRQNHVSQLFFVFYHSSPTCLLLVSPYCLRYKCRGKKLKPCRIRLVIHAVLNCNGSETASPRS